MSGRTLDNVVSSALRNAAADSAVGHSPSRSQITELARAARDVGEPAAEWLADSLDGLLAEADEFSSRTGLRVQIPPLHEAIDLLTSAALEPDEPSSDSDLERRAALEEELIDQARYVSLAIDTQIGPDDMLDALYGLDEGYLLAAIDTQIGPDDLRLCIVDLMLTALEIGPKVSDETLHAALDAVRGPAIDRLLTEPIPEFDEFPGLNEADEKSDADDPNYNTPPTEHKPVTAYLNVEPF